MISLAATPPPSSPELPRTPPRATVHKSVPVTPAKSGGFHYTSPTKEGYNIDWLRAGAISQGVAGGAVAKVPNPSGSFMPAYAVFCGHNVGAHENWIDAHRQITGARSPFQCKFHSLAAAEKGHRGPTRWFVVAQGINPGIYSSALECHLNVAGVPNSRFKSVGTLAEAEAVFTALGSSS
ncbi:hypothetical protein C8R43DRAFT_951993 [Mycena crocata]|nr:hypothetical protein C8R43DRAFT_951993 [Mycena crocata]